MQDITGAALVNSHSASANKKFTRSRRGGRCISAAADKSANPVDLAANWLATGSAGRTKALVPQLQDRFGLTALQAVQARREGHLIKARAA
ncbi:MAG: hypothetical protein E5X40_11020 [Mesorhizobium sp.]|nr:hypothetical protein EOA86_22345 [Mesorhizobium sp. M5C.F.Ca.IN.020.32.2.1]RUV91382.1 hypothetical protein EOA88_10775 [Mesorhizobium sp. M5C.F.Ca.IN.020.14.1.1]RWG45990.1 MAG: hypothetical protein EOQ62_16055 [Mesorhizobium sp.]RWH49785.1 MAG: hypothetical protein EOQ80_06010 [Mesorhizobium sp.]RWH55450.1 MAG: hypothetical protein EOQ82_16355 [Mesorhizobium sp.]